MLVCSVPNDTRLSCFSNTQTFSIHLYMGTTIPCMMLIHVAHIFLSIDLSIYFLAFNWEQQIWALKMGLKNNQIARKSIIVAYGNLWLNAIDRHNFKRDWMIASYSVSPLSITLNYPIRQMSIGLTTPTSGYTSVLYQRENNYRHIKGIHVYSTWMK